MSAQDAPAPARGALKICSKRCIIVRAQRREAPTARGPVLPPSAEQNAVSAPRGLPAANDSLNPSPLALRLTFLLWKVLSHSRQAAPQSPALIRQRSKIAGCDRGHGRKGVWAPAGPWKTLR